MTCRGRCSALAVSRPWGSSPYMDGLRRCTSCEVWLEEESARCPCCNRVLKTRSRGNKARVKYREAFARI